jgi:DegV family protein with EDD domain
MLAAASGKPMPLVAIVTDSSACLPAELAERYGVTIVPLAFLFGGEVYHDGDLTGNEFYARLRDDRQPLTTAAPAPGEYLEAFRRVRESGATAVLCLTLSSRYSGAHSSAVKAAEYAAKDHPGLALRVIDTGGIAMAHGFAVLAAARMASAGGTLAEASAAAERAAESSNLVGLLDTTRYLARSGRVPWVLHWVASLLRIKPVIAAAGGRIGAVGRVRTTERGIERMLSYVAERARPGAPLRIAVMHAAERERAQELAGRLRTRLAPEELLITEFTSTMAVHTGPGFIGLAWQTAEPAAEPALVSKRRSRWLQRDVSALEAALGSLPHAVDSPPLLVLSGLPASGKSHLAREIARRHPFAVLESDALRKALVKRPRYSHHENARLFAACHALLEDLLSKGIPCLFDATNLKEVHRRPLYEIAGRTGARLLIVEVRAGEDVIGRRLDARLRTENSEDRSEATRDVYESMRREAEPIERHHLVVDASAEIGPAIEEVLRHLHGAGVCG